MKLLLLLMAAALPVFAQCPYAFTPDPSQTIAISANASAAPNAITVTVTAGCNWEYSTDSSWITFPGVTVLFGSGSGAIGWEAAVNIGPGGRTGHITILTINGGRTVYTVFQAAPVCSLTLSPASASAVVGGGTGSFQLQTNCTWAAYSLSRLSRSPQPAAPQRLP